MEHDEGLGLGNFALDSPDLPLPHPFCRCSYYIDGSKSLKEIGEEIGGWVGGEENTKIDNAFAKWKLENFGNRDTIKLPDIRAARGIGAKHRDSFFFKDPDGKYDIFVPPEEHLRDVEVFAGKGTKSEFRDAWRYEESTDIPASEWQKVKGFGWVNYQGEEYYAEIHWVQAEGTGRMDMKLKVQEDGRWWLDER